MTELGRRLAAGAWRWCVLFGGVMVFASLGIELYQREEVALDSHLFDWLLSIRAPWLTDLMRSATELGSSTTLVVVVVAGGIVFGVLHHPRSAAFLGTVGVGAALINAGLKALFSRARPEELLRIIATDGYAFPSGHSMGSAAVYGALALIIATRFPRHRHLGVALCGLIIFVVGFSRAYLFVHYPSDVLAGWGLGLTCALWLKPAILGRGLSPETVPAKELSDDGVDPAEARGAVAD